MARYRILLAEDDETTLAMMLDMLSIRAYDAVAARNGEEAVEMARERKPDLVLMDVRMPVMDGLDAVRKIRAVPGMSGIPIIAVTASVGNDEADKQLAAGCTAHLPKPVQTKELFEMLDRYLPGGPE